jgi:uncharacterized membrane protein
LNTYFLVSLLLVVTLTFTTFTYVMIICLKNKLNFCYYHNFPMKHFLHFSKLWIICHLMSIQTTNVAFIWRCFLWFFYLVVLPLWLPPWSNPFATKIPIFSN